MFHEGLENIMRRRPLPAVMYATALAGVLGLALVGCADAPTTGGSTSDPSSTAFPAEVTSCGHTTVVESAPTSAVTLNQGATEVMLALGLEDSMTGTAYLDEAIADQWQAAYDTVPVLSEEYPSHEDFLAAAPDFAYASYTSAFDDEVAGGQDDLEAMGIASYLSPFGCADDADKATTSWESAWGEIEDIGTVFGIATRADEIVDTQRTTLEGLRQSQVGKGLTVLWYDSGTKTPYVGAGGGGPQLVMDAVGLDNAFDSLDGGWADASWEEVLKIDPDVIVLADASWDTAADKKTYLESDPVLSQLTAVESGHFVTVSFAESTPGVRLIDGASTVAEQIEALGLGK